MLKYLLLFISATAFAADGDRILRNPNSDKDLLLQVSPGGTPQTAVSISGTTGQVSFPQGATGVAGVTNEVTNGLTNFSFEGGVASWTASGGSFTQISGANVLAGTYSGQWASATTGNTLTSNAWTVPKKLKGKACAITGSYAYESGAAGDYTVTLWDGSAESIIQEVSLSATSASSVGQLSIGFTCPTSGTVALRFKAKVASPGNLVLDDLHLGNDYRVGTTNDQAELIAVASYNPIANCFWQLTSTSLAPFPADVGGECQSIVVEHLAGGATINTADNDLGDIVFTYLPPGKYMVVATATAGPTTNGANGTLAISDGTNIRGSISHDNQAADVDFNPYTVTANFQYTQGGPRTFIIAGRANSGQMQISNNANERRLRFNVYRFPNQSPRDTVTLETQGWYVDANIGGANADTGTGAVTPYATLSNANLDMVINPGSASVKIACDTVAATGLTCSGSNENVGITVDIPKAGVYEVCMAFGFSHGGAGQSQISHQLVETADGSSTIITEGKGRYYNSGTNGTLDDAASKNVCGIFSWSSAGSKTIKLAYQKVATSGFVRHLLDRASSGLGARDAHITMYPITQNFPQAVAIVERPAAKFFRTDSTDGVSGSNPIRWDGTKFNVGDTFTLQDLGDSIQVATEGVYLVQCTMANTAVLAAESAAFIRDGTTTTTLAVGSIKITNSKGYDIFTTLQLTAGQKIQCLRTGGSVTTISGDANGDNTHISITKLSGQ